MTPDVLYDRALGLLQKASTAEGFVASPRERDNYRRVWTRDGVVCGLAALLSKDEELIATFQRTLVTILSRQHRLGFIPSNVTSSGEVSYGGTAGRADNPSWAVIGICHYVLTTGDQTMRDRYLPHVERCLTVLDIWEYNGKHLIYVPQSGDWADEYSYHGYVLSDQLLRLWALRLAAEVYGREEWALKAGRVTSAILANYWIRDTQTVYSPNMLHQRAGHSSEYWLMAFNPGRMYFRFDLLANALALLLLEAPAEHATCLEFLKSLEHRHLIAPAFHPPVMDDEWEMKELETNFAYAFRNKPFEFHNGGLWPVWNGFLVMALRHHGEHARASGLTDRLHAANAKGGDDFNECLHGRTEEPSGVSQCSWSAAGAVIASCAVRGEKLHFGKP